MPDVFIGYTMRDEEFAAFLYRHLIIEALDVFMAPIFVEMEQANWAAMKNLKNSDWPIFLASRAACHSAEVRLEFGIARRRAGKKLVPIVWDTAPDDLPNWMLQRQVIHLAGASADVAKDQIANIANQIHANERTGYIIVGLLLAAISCIGDTDKILNNTHKSV